jgi:hypothetical protein
VALIVMFGFLSVNALILRSNDATSAGLSGFGLLPTVIVTGALWSIAPPLSAAGVVPSAHAAALSSRAADVNVATHLAVLVIGTPQGVWAGPQ